MFSCYNEVDDNGYGTSETQADTKQHYPMDNLVNNSQSGKDKSKPTSCSWWRCVPACGRKRPFPPGPRGYPLLGNLPQMDVHLGLHETFNTWRETYGDVYGIRFGQRRALVLNGYDVIRDALVNHKETFMDSPKLYLLHEIFQDRGIIFSPYGPQWKEMRRIAGSTMKELGVGKNTLEEKIVCELDVVEEQLLQTSGRPVSIRRFVEDAMANVIFALCFGRRIAADDATFHDLQLLLNDFFRANPVATPVNIFPWLRHVPVLGEKLMRPKTILDKTKRLIQHEVDQHRLTLDPSTPRDMVDMFLVDLEQRQATPEETRFQEEQVVQTVHDVFNAGCETGATATQWLLLYLVRNPEAQERCHADITRVCGDRSSCSFKDRPQLPYVEACILETLRMANINPITPPHSTMTDVTFRGYHIPQGTMVFVNLWSIHYDPELWPNPKEWRPERWIDEEGKLIRHKAFAPFSMGYRTCPGQHLVFMQLFLLLSNLILKFRFSPAVPGELPSDDGTTGISRVPLPYMLRCESRK